MALPMARSRHELGFTLLEILVVLTIASVLMVLVPMSFSKGMHQLQGQGAVRDLITTLSKARSQAINRQQVVRIGLEPRAFWLEAADKKRLAPHWQIETVKAGVALVEQTEPRFVHFYPDGSADGVELALTDGRRRYPIKVDWLTGRVRADEPTAVEP